MKANKLCILLAAAAAGSALAEAEGEGLVEQESKNAWHFRVGPVMAPRVRVRVNAPRLQLPTYNALGGSSSAGAATAPADPSAGFVSRAYTDGHVNPDEGTSDPGTAIHGLTWNWGAQDVGAQHVGSTMEFRTGEVRWNETVSSSTSAAGASSDHDRDILLGVEAMGGWTFFDNDTFDAAVDLGFRFYGTGDLSMKARNGLSVTTTRNSYRYVDSYDASGWTDAPHGSYSGTAGGPGRLLGATPSRREEQMASESFLREYKAVSGTKLNYRIWDLRLGPTLGWQATDWLTVRGGVYGLLGLVDAHLSADIETPTESKHKSKSTCSGVFGMAAGLSAQVKLTDNLSLMGGVEYDWWSDAVSLSAGGADARVKLSDFTASLGLGVEF